ncbi:MAG: hypothetical protein ACKEQK_00545 [Candidatus Hodgkinia cicadicola]
MLNFPSSTCNHISLAQSSLIKRLNLKNIHELPKLNKIIVYSGINYKHDNVRSNSTFVKSDIELITNTKAVCSKAKRTIVNFNIKRGDVIGWKATLKGVIMYKFLNNLVKTVLPKTKTFEGLNLRSFDMNHNITFGIIDYSVFSDETHSISGRLLGLNITLCIGAKCLSHSVALLSEFGFCVTK